MIARPDPTGPLAHAHVVLAQARGDQDFTIPAPQADPAAPQAAPRAETGQNPFGSLERGATGTEIALGAAALVVLAVVFLFVRGAVRTHLINRRAALDAADGASWMLFSALTLTASVIVTATVGRLWQFWAGLAAAFCLCLILFGAALVLFLRAPERRR